MALIGYWVDFVGHVKVMVDSNDLSEDESGEDIAIGLAVEELQFKDVGDYSIVEVRREIE